MPSIKLKYVKQQVRKRRRKDGTCWKRLYYYYRRPGAPDDEKPLPGDPSQPCFHACLEQFNLRAERIEPAQIPGSFAHLVALYAHLVAFYKEAPDFKSLAEKTRYDTVASRRRLVRTAPERHVRHPMGELQGRNYEAGVIKVWQHKTKKWVRVPAPEKLRNLLDSMERRSPFMFVEEVGRP